MVKNISNNKLLNKFNQVEDDLDKSEEKYSLSVEKITQIHNKPDVVTSSYLKTVKLFFVFLTVLINFFKVNLLILTSVVRQSLKFFKNSNEVFEKSLKENITNLDQRISLRTAQLQNLKSSYSFEEGKILSDLVVNFKNESVGYENKLSNSTEDKIIILKNIQNAMMVLNENITSKGMEKCIEAVRLEINQKGKNINYNISFTLSQLPYRWSQFFFKFVNSELQASLSLINSEAEYELVSNTTLGIENFIIRIDGGDLQAVLKSTNQKETKQKKKTSLYEVGPQ